MKKLIDFVGNNPIIFLIALGLLALTLIILIIILANKKNGIPINKYSSNNELTEEERKTIGEYYESNPHLKP